MKKNFLALDSLKKQELASIKGGLSSRKVKKCACVCAGPAIPVNPGYGKPLDPEEEPDAACTDCGWANAFKALNPNVDPS